MRYTLLLRAWAPAVVWMCLIFAASTDLGSTTHSSRILVPFLRWLKPDISKETIDTVQVMVRKGGHAAGYATLALLLWRAFRLTSAEPRPWSAKIARAAVFWAFVYACSDEFHQLFVPSRGASVWDVLLDTVGASIGIGALWMIGRLFRRW